MQKKTLQLLNEKFNLNYNYTQITVLQKSIKIKNNKKDFLQFLNILLTHRKKFNLINDDFYQIKEILFNIVNDIPHVHTIDKYIKRYGFTKGNKLYKDYCKRKCKNMNNSENQRKKSLKFQEKRKNSPELYDGIYSNQLNYWLDKGYTELESKQLLKERQTTFSLKKCIEKYGSELGTEKWNQRQKKWQETLKSKSQEEQDDINRRKSQGIRKEWDKDTLGKLYYIHFYNENIEFWKIGITTLTVKSGRFEHNMLFFKKFNLNYNIIFEINDNIFNSFYYEQKILKKFNNNRISINYNGFKSTECFNKDIFEGKIINESNIHTITQIN